jgi:hypothetical protein
MVRIETLLFMITVKVNYKYGVLVVIGIIYCIIPINLFAQSSIHLNQIQKVENTSIFEGSNIVQKLKTNKLFIHNNSILNTITVSVFNLETNEFEKSIVVKYDLSKMKDYLNDFDFRNDSVLILSYKKLLLFKLKGDTAYLLNETPLYMGFENCYFSDSKILVTLCYNKHKLDGDFKSGLLIYDLNLKNLDKKIINTDAIPFTHAVGNYYDYYNSKLVVTNVLRKKIWIFDNSGTVIDSIGDNQLFNNGLNKIPINYAFDASTSSPKDTIYKILEFDKTITRIQKVFFINDTTILVSIKSKGKGLKRQLIKFEKHNLQWTEKELKIQYKPKEKFSWAYSKPLHFYKNRILFLEGHVPKAVSKRKQDDYLTEFPNYWLYNYEIK